ncbi:MAG: DUF2934 domain-containing protein [Nitrospira sp.]|nr:DUF2934 domain-containing protein [Nitrospira sp.]MDH4370802.1 DUF2934 domain-containing protein [Nitrospira sp.]MDH5498436.1 DUF2934 domain-containing protein [Nitrospira sp.]MDH5725704.1 DUF2934 domain-containing protein [Nitrospira sp.]
MNREMRKDRRKKMNGVAPDSVDLPVSRKIAMRAYELYLERGGVLGHELEDWQQAEREILKGERR